MAMGLPTIGAPVGAASGFLHSNISLPGRGDNQYNDMIFRINQGRDVDVI